jgi:hypothetical protein
MNTLNPIPFAASTVPIGFIACCALGQKHQYMPSSIMPLCCLLAGDIAATANDVSGSAALHARADCRFSTWWYV